MSEYVSIEIVEESISNYDSEGLTEFIDALKAFRTSIPEEHRKSARIEWNTNTDYDGYSECYFKIYYVRPKTYKELKKDAERKETDAQRKRERDLKLLEELKKTYE